MNSKVPDQLIPTLSEVVPLDGARSISVEELIDESAPLLDELRDVSTPIRPAQVEDLADAVLHIVHARLVNILPDLMREAVDEVLSQEGFLGSQRNR